MKKYALYLVPVYAIALLGFLISVLIGNQAVTVISESAKLDNRHCFVIDAGHGGVDGGAVSCSGAYESHINLQIALRLNDLMHLLGYDTIMIRTTDISVYTSGDSIADKKASDLKERVRIVNEKENAILLSIHQNHYSDSRYSGAQVFYPKTQGSEELAKQLQTGFITTLNTGSNRQAKKAEGLYLMKNIEKTGVLIECGFLSNFEEEAKLRNADYQKNICCVVASVCSLYTQQFT